MFGRPVEPPTVTLDQASFRALASEVRVDILKRLDTRRMTVTDLSEALSLSKPTLLEHLERLQGAGLVRRLDEGRKWIYYELTGKARKVLHPERVQIIVALATAVLLAAVGVVAMLRGFQAAALSAGRETLPGAEDPGFQRLGGFGAFGGIGAADAILLGIALLVLAVIPSLTALLLSRRARHRAIDASMVPE